MEMSDVPSAMIIIKSIRLSLTRRYYSGSVMVLLYAPQNQLKSSQNYAFYLSRKNQELTKKEDNFKEKNHLIPIINSQRPFVGSAAQLEHSC